MSPDVVINCSLYFIFQISRVASERYHVYIVNICESECYCVNEKTGHVKISILATFAQNTFRLQ